MNFVDIFTFLLDIINIQCFNNLLKIELLCEYETLYMILNYTFFLFNMNLERAIELVSSLESQIQQSKNEDSTKYGQCCGTVAIYKDIVKIYNFIDNQCSTDYGLRSLIKKFNDIKNVMACELYKKFLLLDFTKDFYINTEILASVSLIYGNLYKTTLINEFCSLAINHMIGKIEAVGKVKYILKLLESFNHLIDSDKVDMFSDDWNISYYLYIEFKRCISDNIKNLDKIKMSDIVDISIAIRNLETHISTTLIKKKSSFVIDCTMCQLFDENQYCSNLYLDCIRSDITKFKETLTINFNVKYNTGVEEYSPNYKTKIQPYITSMDLFTFIRKIFGYTTNVSSGKIFKTACNEIFGLLKHYGMLLLSHTNILQETGFNKISEFVLFSVIRTCQYCMTAIDSMDEHLKLSDSGIQIDKIKVFFSNNIFLKTIDMIVKETIARTKVFAKELHAIKFEEKTDKKEQDRVNIAHNAINKYIDEILKIYGDTTHAFIGKALKGLDEFCFPFAFKSITYQLLESVTQDILGLKNVAPKYSVHLFVIFENLMERIHMLFTEFQSLTKFQLDVDLKLTKINKIFDAIAIASEYTSNEHNKIFGSDNITFENILQLKGQASFINMSNIPTPSMPTIQTITKNPVTNAVKDGAGKFGSFLTGTFDSMTGKDKTGKK